MGNHQNMFNFMHYGLDQLGNQDIKDDEKKDGTRKVKSYDSNQHKISSPVVDDMMFLKRQVHHPVVTPKG